MTSYSFLFLGSGASLGVPVIGCSCAVCRSDNPKNKRLRPSGIIRSGDKQILVDCGPDVRSQLLREGISSLDGVILTHAHYDHVEGIDELRALSIIQKAQMPFLMSKETLEDLQRRFHYIFEHQESKVVITTRLNIELFEGERGEKEFVGLPIKHFTFQQAGMQVQGLRIGTFAYVSDIKVYPETIFEELEGVEILILSALRFQDSRMHFTIDEALAFAERVGAAKTYLTHVAHELDHDQTNAKLPKNVQLAYDGLSIDFNS